MGWRSRAIPETLGMDSCVLEQGLQYIRTNEIRIRSLIVMRDGVPVVEAYRSPDGAATRFDIQSITKSIVSGLVGIALNEGRIGGVQDRVLDYFPELAVGNPSAEKSRMTIEDLLTMRSGLDWDNTKESFLGHRDSVAFILGHAMRAAPGTAWAYSSADTQLVSAILQRVTDRATAQYAQEKLFEPIGIHPGGWLHDKGQITVGGFGLSLTSHDLADLGQLYLELGLWEGRRLIPSSWIEESVKPRIDTPWPSGSMGYAWWVRPGMGYRAGGRYGQQLGVFPEHRLVVVYTAELPLETADTTLDAITDGYILAAIRQSNVTSAKCQVSSELRSGHQSPQQKCDHRDVQLLGDLGFGLSPANTMLVVGDGTTTFCAYSNRSGQICMRGTAADAGPSYKNWGVAFVLRLPQADATGWVEDGFDVTHASIEGFQFEVVGATNLPRGLRVGVTQIDVPGIPYQNNAFLVDGGRRGITTDGTVTARFSEMTQPSWSKLAAGTSLDLTKLFALRFQIATTPGRSFDYDVCISAVAWQMKQ